MSAARPHWREYAIEGWALGTFLLSACLFTALLFHPASPVAASVHDPGLRRMLMGLAMGGTAVSLVYSPWGRRSGAHMNPAVTLSFLRLGRIPGRDAAGYVTAQFAGALAGVALAGVLLGPSIMHPAVRYAVTEPGPPGSVAAFVAETLISFLLMLAVLASSAHPRLARFTGIVAGTLVALYISVEAPISGMSMNPARSLGSAFHAHLFDSLWIYFTAPPLGMLLAAEAFRRLPGRRRGCAKLVHRDDEPCHFCGQRGG